MTDLLKLYLVHEMFRKLQQANDHRQCQLLNFPDVLFCVLWFKLSYFHENEAQNQWQRTWNDANTEPEQKIYIYTKYKNKQTKKKTPDKHILEVDISGNQFKALTNQSYSRNTGLKRNTTRMREHACLQTRQQTEEITRFRPLQCKFISYFVVCMHKQIYSR